MDLLPDLLSRCLCSGWDFWGRGSYSNTINCLIFSLQVGDRTAQAIGNGIKLFTSELPTLGQISWTGYFHHLVSGQWPIWGKSVAISATGEQLYN